MVRVRVRVRVRFRIKKRDSSVSGSELGLKSGSVSRLVSVPGSG